jgi:TonB-linked SusC/RagA family outer membrane protein
MHFNTTAMERVIPDLIRNLSLKQTKKLFRVMRLTAILLLSACITASAKTGAQTITLNEKNSSLEKVFEQIKKQSGYTFAYTESLLSKARAISISVKNATLEQVLDLCLKDQPFTYTIIERTVVIKPKEQSPNADGGSEQLPPPIDIHGRIVNEKGEPVAASIVVKGTNKGTSTNDNGEFELKGVDDNATLVITGVSIESFEVKVNGRNALALNANTKTVVGQEVVINKGYYSVRQRENTGDVTRVSSADIQKQPVSDPMLALQGRVPGLFINSGSGVPGATESIQLRGQNSIANGNSPFFVIDGVPFDLMSTYMSSGPFPVMSPFNILNPADIENIEVLKDADATAIYGSRGANGVVLITTKKGKAGKTKFDVNIYKGFGKVGHMMDLLNTQQYLQMRHEAFNNDGITPNSSNAKDLLLWDTTRYTNWQKVFIGGTEHIVNGQVTISGGNLDNQFLIGGNYNKTGTVFPGSFSDQKASTHINLAHTSANQRLNLQLSASYLIDKSNLPSQDFTTLIGLAPDAPALYDQNGNLNWAIINGAPTWFNPINVIFNKTTTNTNDLVGNLNLGYRILKGLSFKNNLGYNKIENGQSFIYPYPSSQYPSIYYSALPNARKNSFATTQISSWIEEPQLNYQRNIFGGKLEALIGSTFQEQIKNSITQVANGFSTDALVKNIAAATSIRIGNVTDLDYKYSGLYGRLGYNWREKYLINATIRRDGSSRFGKDRQFGNFGAIGAGWIFTNENFLSHLRGISFGKIRVSYGVTGNDQLPDYQYLSTYTPYSYSYQGVSGLLPTSIANPDFGWESVKKLEIGLELGFINDRIFVNGSYYKNRTGNELVGYSLPNITGFSSVQMNLPAIVQNSGLELSLNAEIIKTRSFKWSSSFNISAPRNKLIIYPGIESSNYADRYVAGKSLFIFKGFHYLAVDPTSGTYTFQAKDQNTGPAYPEDLQTAKETSQKYYGGLENTFSFKSWQIDVFFQFTKQTGFNYLSWFGGPAGRFGGASGADGNQPTIVLNRWQKAGDNTDIQKFTTNTGTSAGQAYITSLFYGDNAISDASFIRLKNASISYKLPQQILQKAHIDNCRIYLQGQNIFTITKYLGLDPEVRFFGLPPLRILALGAQVTL